MCYVNKTATFKKVFKDVENSSNAIYKDLPESTLAEKIYKLRMLHGLTQKEFALNTNIGYSTVCKYETGFNSSENILIKICNYFNLNIDYFKK